MKNQKASKQILFKSSAKGLKNLPNVAPDTWKKESTLASAQWRGFVKYFSKNQYDLCYSRQRGSLI